MVDMNEKQQLIHLLTHHLVGDGNNYYFSPPTHLQVVGGDNSYIIHGLSYMMMG